MSRRIGILGGSFDPPHVGHLALAQAAHSELALDVVHIIPAAQAPLKDSGPHASSSDRILLLRLAFDSYSWAVIDGREVTRGGISYSIDTARELHAENPGDELYWILGADQLTRLHLWREASALCGLVKFAVLLREGEDAKVDATLATLAKVVYLKAPPVNLSSSEIRQALAAGRSTEKALLPAVSDCIQARNLYHI
jgi:nicotinate-nucleotide adenylyltransferase